ncbi:MAG TPA: hypothetical protein VJL31_16570 [Gemmatimonadales bacterium]|nr:hypothetical protein [Gemmatimonadales bacterium]
MTPVLFSALIATSLGMQQADLRQRLVDRGAAPEFAQQVVQVVAAARTSGLPVEPLADKAFEGLAKGYPAERILPVVQLLADRLRAGRTAALSAGLTQPSGRVVAAAAEALGRGMERNEVVQLLQAAPGPDAASVGLTVAASLVAQGIASRDATHAVETAYHEGRSARELLELPSVTSSWFAEGVTLPEVVKRIHQGQALPFPPGRGGAQGGPPGLRPGTGPPINPPGKPGTRPKRP